MLTLKKLTIPSILIALSGCMSPESEKSITLVPVAKNIEHNAEQVHLICHSEALNVRQAVRSSGPTRITVNTAPTGGGFAGGFASGFNSSYNPGPSGNRESKAAYAACAARLGYVTR